MKYFKILAILLFSSVISFYACNDATKTEKKEDPKPFKAADTPTPINANNANAANTQTSQNSGDVFHYTCSNGCAGGAAAAGNCANCGNPLAHNQAFHANTNNDATATTPFMTPPAAETGKNAAGVWHYTCGNGCAGGSGAAGNCGSCGSALAHNTAYHN